MFTAHSLLLHLVLATTKFIEYGPREEVLSGVNGVYVISLPRRRDRLARFLRTNGLSLETVHLTDGFAGRELRWTESLRRLFGRNRFGSRRGLVGQALSHFTLWRHAAATLDQFHLIMEDDAELTPGFVQRWNDAYQHAFPPDARIIFLGGVASLNLESYHSGNVLQRVSRHFNLHKNNTYFSHNWDPATDVGVPGAPSRSFFYKPIAYMISSAAAKDLVRSIGQHGFLHPVGVTLMKMMRRWEDVYAIHPLQAALPALRPDLAGGVDSDAELDEAPVPDDELGGADALLTEAEAAENLLHSSTMAALARGESVGTHGSASATHNDRDTSKDATADGTGQPTSSSSTHPGAPEQEEEQREPELIGLQRTQVEPLPGENTTSSFGTILTLANDFQMGMVVINLNESVDRMRSFDTAAQAASLGYHRIPGSDGRAFLPDNLLSSGLVSGMWERTERKMGATNHWMSEPVAFVQTTRPGSFYFSPGLPIP